MYIYVDALQNIYFNMKDSGHLTIFSFSIWENQGSYLFIRFSLQIHYSVSQGSGVPLGPPEVVALLTVKYAFSDFLPDTFSSKNITIIHLGTMQNIYSI